MKVDFTTKLLKWNTLKNRRSMPWKGEKDPYKIWLSEIILQQTRVDQGLEYYNRFVKAFPTISKLSKAPEKEVFKLWEGLGYYSRCKNLIATAKFIAENNKGRFPDNYEAILALKGVGPYTAAAVASFAYNLPYAVLDGNVFRVLSRYFGISTPIDNNDGKRLYSQLANELLDKKHAGIYNQAIMDLGAVICKPQKPLCMECPQKKNCRAFQYQWTSILPMKEKILKKKTRWFYYFIVNIDDNIVLRKRDEKDIWQNLYEFVLYETESIMVPDKKTLSPIFKKLFGKTNLTIQSISVIYKQQLTHQTIVGQFITVKADKLNAALKDYELVKTGSLHNYPFPKIITSYLKEPVTPLQLF